MSYKKIGFWTCSALVIGNMIGSGIFLLPASLAAFGGISLVGWFFSSLGAILLAIIFGNLGQLLPHLNGGPYAYTRLKLGDFPGFLVAWGYWISIWCTNAAIAAALVGYLSVFFPSLNGNPLLSILTGLSFIWLITWINTKPLRTIGFVQLISTVLKVVPIALIAFLGIFYIKIGHFTPFNLSQGSNFSAITETMTLTFFAFLGMESATIPGSSIDSSGNTIRKATIFGTVLTMVIYVLSFAAIMGIVPAEILAKSNAPFADAAELFWGNSAKYIVAAGAVISTIGALNGWILLQGQIPMAAAKDKLFPAVFERTNKNGSPVLGIVISSLLISFLMMTKFSESLAAAFTFMMKLSTLTVIIPYLFSITTYAILLFESRTKNFVMKIITLIITFLFLLWVIIGCGEEIVYYGFLLLMGGIPFYVILKINVPKKNS